MWLFLIYLIDVVFLLSFILLMPACYKEHNGKGRWRCLLSYMVLVIHVEPVPCMFTKEPPPQSAGPKAQRPETLMSVEGGLLKKKSVLILFFHWKSPQLLWETLRNRLFTDCFHMWGGSQKTELATCQWKIGCWNSHKNHQRYWEILETGETLSCFPFCSTDSWLATGGGQRLHSYSGKETEKPLLTSMRNTFYLIKYIHMQRLVIHSNRMLKCQI